MTERAVGELQQQSRKVAPLPQRRNPPKQALQVDSICDWDSGEVQVCPTFLPCPPQSLHPHTVDMSLCTPAASLSLAPSLTQPHPHQSVPPLICPCPYLSLSHL